MKNKASVLLKQVMAALSSLMKAKSMAAKSKTNAAKARLLMFSLMKNKKVLMYSISHKIHSVLGHDHHDKDDDAGEGENDKAIVMYKHEAAVPSHDIGYEEADDAGGSIIDIARSKGQDFKLEDEIDHVADLFIRRFHKQIRLQKLESFKRYQEMLLRGSA